MKRIIIAMAFVILATSGCGYLFWRDKWDGAKLEAPSLDTRPIDKTEVAGYPPLEKR